MINSFKLIQIKAETFPYISDLFVQYGRHAVQKGAPKVNELSVHLIFTQSSPSVLHAHQLRAIAKFSLIDKFIRDYSISNPVISLTFFLANPKASDLDN